MSKFNLDTLKMGYFIVYKTTSGWFSNLIVNEQLKNGYSKEDAQYTHVETSGGNKHSVNISPPRSKQIDITKVHKGRYIKIVRYKNEEYENKKRYKVAYFSAVLCNITYDGFGVAAFLKNSKSWFSFLFKWVKHNNRLYFCSEGSALALQRCFTTAFHGESPQYIMPADFLNEREFEVVWEGIIE